MRDRLEFNVECLEDRRLLAGTVNATVNAGGNLVINGDGGDNELALRIAADGQVSVIDSFDTNLVGNLSSPVTGGVVANLGGGNDRLTIYVDAVLVDGTIAIDTGPGDDSFTLRGSGTDVVGNLRIQTGAGNDFVSVQGLLVQQDATLITGPGDDFATFAFSTVGDINLFLGDGNDTVHPNGDFSASQTDNTVGGNLSINGGTGRTTVYAVGGLKVDGDTSIRTASLDDSISLFDFHPVGALRVSSGAGADTVRVHRDSITGPDPDVAPGAAFLNTFGGDDEITVTGGSGVVVIRSGAGDDDIDVRNLAAGGSLFAVLASGDDEFSYSVGPPILPGGDVYVDAGGGNDGIGIGGGTINGDVEVTTRRGADSIFLSPFDLNGNVRLETGQGNDRVTVTGTIEGNLNAILGTGFDRFDLKFALVNGPFATINGANDVSLSYSSVGSIFVETEDTADSILVTNLTTTGSNVFNTGGGNDFVRFEALAGFGLPSTAQPVAINTGNGRDDIEIEGFVDRATDFVIRSGHGSDTVALRRLGSSSVSSSVFVEMLSGNDELLIEEFLGSFIANGGGGTDVLRIEPFTTGFHENFEIEILI